jgi:hypothetical protein
MNPIPLSWTIGGAAFLLAALGGTGWLLYDAIEDKGRLAATIEAKDKAIAKLGDDLKRQEREARVRQEITDAADRAVVSVDVGRDVIRSRVVTIIREIRTTPDANDPAPDSLVLALERVRQSDAGTGDRDEGGAAGAAPSPPARP